MWDLPSDGEGTGVGVLHEGQGSCVVPVVFRSTVSF